MKHTRVVVLHADRLDTPMLGARYVSTFCLRGIFADCHALIEQRELLRVGRELLPHLQQVAKFTVTHGNALAQRSDGRARVNVIEVVFAAPEAVESSADKPSRPPRYVDSRLWGA